MRRLLAATTLTAAALAPPFASPAAAESPGTGFGCSFSTYPDPEDPLGPLRYVEMDGGPLLLDDGTTARTGRLACSLQADLVRHSDADVVRFVSPTTTGVVALAPSYARADLGYAFLYLCTGVQVDGVGTFYWDAEAAEWSADPDAPCGNWIQPGPTPVPDPPDVVRLIEERVDPVVCPVFALVAPPQGDVPGVWDCPPYGWEAR